MSDKKKGISRYRLGERILIGYRDDDTIFWIKTDEDYWNTGKNNLNVLEAGKAWIDKKSDTTILDFPTTDGYELQKISNDFLGGSDWLTPYKETDYYVNLMECLRSIPEKPDDPPCEWIDPYYELPEHIDGYILDKNTFLRRNNETGKLYYIKVTEFSENDIENDRFGWVKAARKFLSVASDEELLSDLKGFMKESYGDAWIDENNDVVVLGPVHEQEPEIIDNFYVDRLSTYYVLYSAME